MRELAISTGRSCYVKVWKNGTVQWRDLCGKLETTIRTKETVAEYHKMRQRVLKRNTVMSSTK